MLTRGIGSGAPQIGLNEIESRDIIESLQKIINKPIKIQHDSSRNTVARKKADHFKALEIS